MDKENLNKVLKTTEFITTKSFKLAIYRKGSDKASKLALVLPGKMDTKDYPHMHSHVDFLSTKGYLALSFDPSGTWESEGSIEEYSASNYFKAIKEIIEFYGNKPTLLVGHSRGGSIAILAGTKIKQVERFAVIMTNPDFKKHFPDLEWKEKGFRTHFRDTPTGYDYETKEFSLPYRFLEDDVQYEVLDDLKKCKKPKLFVAGLKDIHVKVEDAQKTYDLSAEPKYIELIDSEHDYRKDKKSIEKVNELLGKFILKNS